MELLDQVLASLQSLQGWPACLAVFAVLAATGFGLPVNEDLLLLAAAALTLKGMMDPLALVVAGWLGVLCADTLIFHWGHRFGAQLLRHRLAARLVPPQRLEAMQHAMRRWGPGYLFAVRFMPGLRTALLFAAGSLKIPYRQLFVFDGLAAAIELPLLVYGVRYVGGNWERILEAIGRWQALLWPLLAVLAAAAWWMARRRRRAGSAGPGR
jgi:membrane protein DedA with SNARE-associated domain